jgi:uncharacterized protein (DUF488 family)
MTIHSSASEISTIGHSNVPAKEIVGLLQKHQIQVVVDVRSIPYSQYAPQFGRENLSRILEQAGIGYTFAGEYLGGRPQDPTCYRNGQLPDGKADYLQLVDYAKVAERPWFQRAIVRLIEIAREKRTAILCSEEDPYRCHRHHLIAQALLAQGIVVWHLRGSGQRELARSVAGEEAQGQPVQQLAMF